MKQIKTRLVGPISALCIGTLATVLVTQMRAQHGSVVTSQTATGQYVTPTAPSGSVQQFLNPHLAAYPNFVAGEAVRSRLSPDGKTLAVLCAGQNSLDKADGTLDTAASTQFIFLYDVTGSNKQTPQLIQVIQQTNSHVGLVFSPDGNTLYAAGGKDDVVYAYSKSGALWTLAGTIALGHAGKGIGVGVGPNASGLGISTDGKTLVVANNYNDSISVIDTATRTVRYEHDLRPYFVNNEGISGGVGGTFPFGVEVLGNTAYVSSDRDREVVVVDISSKTSGRLIKRVKLDGNGLGMTLDAASSRLFVAEDNADQVAVIDTSSNTVVARIDARAPASVLAGSNGKGNGNGNSNGDGNGKGNGNDKGNGNGKGDGNGNGNGNGKGSNAGSPYMGVATFAVTLSPDGRTLYAVNAAANSIAVIPLRTGDYKVTGLIPTAYEPHDITFSADGTWMYIVNGKSVTGPNPSHLASNTGSMTSISNGKALAAASAASNQYQFQLERASLVSAPVPSESQMESLTKLVADNNFYSPGIGPGDKTMDFMSSHIKHIVYIVKENRTFDQVLGDLNNGANADASLTQFGEAFTPNFHKVARQFVTLDNFTDPGDGSMDGWSWSLQGRVTNTETITQQINYAFVNRGLSYESEGANRNVPVNLGTVAARDAVGGPAGTTNYSLATAALPGGTPNVLAGTGNHASSDAPFGMQNGYIFDAVLQAGKTVRNYGFLVNNIGRTTINGSPVKDPFSAGEIQVGPLDPTLAPLTDIYFRGYDQSYPDVWRYNEWKREFDQFVGNGYLPSLTTLRISHDHMGNFASALGGVNTPETQQADDDLAAGLIIQAISNSPYAKDTLILITEDDCQDGPDHVDSHRATTYVVGPYVKRGTVVSTHYSQINVLRTIEDILGTQHLNLNTAFQGPMSDVFDTKSSGKWSYIATSSTVLQTTQLAQGRTGFGGVEYASGPRVKPQHNAAYWAKATVGFDFSDADQVPPAKFNRVLWKGLMHGKPLPASLANTGTAKKDDD